MAGPRMGRVVGLVAAAAVAAAVAFALVGAERPVWPLAVPSLLVAAYSVARLVLWALTAGPPRPARPRDDRDRAMTVLAEARTEIAVIAGDAPSVHVRTAVLSAIASAAQPRVMLVGSDPRLDELARSLGVRRVDAPADWDAGVAAALGAARGDLLLLLPATCAVVPGAIGRVVDHFESGCVWVQTTAVAAGDREVLDQFAHAVVLPGHDRRNAVPWTGPGSIVAVDAFRTHHDGAPAAVVTRRLQARGWHGRFSTQSLLVPLSDRIVAVPRGSSLRTLLTRRVRLAQRMVAMRESVDRQAPWAAVTAVVTVAAAAATGEVPVPFDHRLAPLGCAVVLACLARVLLSRGIVRPGALARADLVAVSAPARMIEPGVRARLSGAPGGLRALAVLLHLGLAAGAVRVVDERRRGVVHVDDVALLGLGLVTSVVVLGAARMLVRNRRMRVARRVPVQVRARIGEHAARVVDLSADGFRLETTAPATLLAVLGVRFQVEGRRPVDVRAQVIRVERSSRGWLIGARMLGGEAVGAHDDYLGMWLANAAAVSSVTPTVARVPHLGRMPVRAVGAPLLRLAAAVVVLMLGVAAFPVDVTRAAPTAGTVTAPAVAATSATTSSTSTTSTAPSTTSSTASSTASSTTAVVGDDAGATTTVAAHSAADPETGAGATSTSVLTGDVGGTRPTLLVTTTAVSNDPSDTTEGQVRFGTPFTWQIEVRNVSAAGDDGERVAHGLDLTDTLPANWTYVATVATVPISCDVAPVITPTDAVQTIVWTDMCDLPPGQSVTITFSALPGLAASTDPGLFDDEGQRIAHVNRVQLSAEDAEGTTLGTASATASAFPRLVDVRVRLTDGSADGDGAVDSAGFVLGSIGRYRIDVDDVGPDAATGPITATLTLPAGVGVWSAAGDGWTCTPGLALVCTTPGPVPVDGALPPIRVEVAVGPEALNDADGDGDPMTGSVTASVTVTGSDLDTDPATDTDTEVTPVRRLADLDLTSTPWPSGQPVAGERVDLLLSVTNLGPSSADGVVIVDDPIPAGLRAVSAGGNGWSCGASRAGRAYTADPDTNGTLTCQRTVRDLAPGAVLPALPVRVQVDPFLGLTGVPTPGLVGTVRSFADIDPANDTAERSSAPAPVAALTVAAIDDRSVRAAGDTVTTEVVVTNRGPAVEAGPVTVSGAADDAFDVSAAAGDGWACTVADTWTCTWNGPDTPGTEGPDAVAPGSHLPPLLVTATVTGDAVAASAADGTVDQTVTLVGTTDAVAHTATVTRTVRPRSELTIDATTSTGPWVTGEPAELTLTVSALGPSPEQGPVAITHLLPPGVQVGEVSGSGWSCEVRRGRDDGPSGTVACQHDRRGLTAAQALLEPGESLPPVTVSLVVSPDAMDVATVDDAGRGSIAWGSAVRGTTDTTVRRSTGDVGVRRAVTLDAAIAVPEQRVRVGERTTATVTVHNDGDRATVDPTTVTVRLPAGITVAATHGGADGWTCTLGEATAACRTDAPLGAASASAFTLDLDVEPSAREAGNTASLSVALEGVSPVTSDVLVLAAAADETSPSTVPASAAPTPVVRTRTTVDLASPAGVLGLAASAAALALAVVLATGRRRLPLC